MKKLILVFALWTFACASVPLIDTIPPTPTTEVFEAPHASITRPFPQHVTYAPTSILPAHRTRDQLDDDVRAYIDLWKENYLAAAEVNDDGITMYRVVLVKEEPKQSTTVSEGRGYGLILVPIK